MKLRNMLLLPVEGLLSRDALPNTARLHPQSLLAGVARVFGKGCFPGCVAGIVRERLGHETACGGASLTALTGAPG